MFQLNIYLKPGQATYEGHRIVGWDRPFHVEFFDSVSALEHRRDFWQSQGVRVEDGKLTKRARG